MSLSLDNRKSDGRVRMKLKSRIRRELFGAATRMSEMSQVGRRRSATFHLLLVG